MADDIYENAEVDGASLPDQEAAAEEGGGGGAGEPVGEQVTPSDPAEEGPSAQATDAPEPADPTEQEAKPDARRAQDEIWQSAVGRGASQVRDIGHIGQLASETTFEMSGGQVGKIGQIGPHIGDTYIYQDSEIPVFVPMDPDDVQRRQRVFVPPGGYWIYEEEQSRRGNRVFVLKGPEQAGKLTCAVNLACDLWPAGDQPEILLYQRRPNDSLSLVEVIEREEFPQGTVVILEDAFAKNVPLKELDPAAIPNLDKALETKDALLLLTTTLGDVPLANLGVDALAARPESLRAVLATHLNEISGLFSGTEPLRDQDPADERARRVLEAWDRLFKLLLWPAHIERFCRKLLMKEPADTGGLLELAKAVAASGRGAVRDWFAGLRRHEKLFALLCFLLEGVQRNVIESVYVWALRQLRTGGMSWLPDPARIGLDDCLEAIRAHASGGNIEFDERSIRDEVGLQVGNSRPLSQAVVLLLVDQVKSPGGIAIAQLERVAGTALGRLAMHDPGWFGTTVNQLIDDANRGVACAAYALEQAASLGDVVLAERIAIQLRAWAGSNVANRHWAAARSLWSVYQALSSAAQEAELREERQPLLQHLEQSLTRLAKTSKRLDNVAFAVQRMSVAQPKRVAELLTAWLDHETAQALGKAAARSVQEIFAKLRPNSPYEKYSPLLGLLEPVVRQVSLDARAFESLFTKLRAWLALDDWRLPIFSTQLAVANYGASQTRDKLRAALARWWLGREPHAAHQMAQAISARCLAMEGILMDRPHLGRGLLVLDSGFEASAESAVKAARAALRGDASEGNKSKLEKAEQQAAYRRGICRQLLALLQSQLDVTVRHLGCLEPGAGTGEAACEPPLAPAYPVPRLLLPPIDQLKDEELAVVVALSAAPIWDLEDALDCPWARNFFLVTAAPEAESTAPVAQLALGSDSSSQSLEAVEQGLELHWAKALAAARPEDWWPMLESLAGDRVPLSQDPAACLADWTEMLDQPTAATDHEDLARRILCAIGWLAARDLRGCAELLAGWLVPQVGDGRRHRAMATAGARMLLAIHGGHPPSFQDRAPGILFDLLAWPLAAQSVDGAESVLRAVRVWLQEPTWAAYLAGGSEDGRGRLLRWAEQFTPSYLAELEAALPSPAEGGVPGVADEAREAIAALLDRLRLRLALGREHALPALGYGERYGLVVCDCTEPDGRSQGRLAGQLVAALHEPALRPIVYRLGETRPAWADDAPPPSGLVPGAAAALPRLLGGLLATAELTPDNVRFVLVLSARPPLDLEDWIDTPWRDRILFHRADGNAWREPLFATLPALPAEAGAIVRHLQKSWGRGA